MSNELLYDDIYIINNMKDDIEFFDEVDYIDYDVDELFNMGLYAFLK